MMAGLLDGEVRIDPLAMGLLAASQALATPRAMGGGFVAGMGAFQNGLLQGDQLQRQRAMDALRTQLVQAQIGETTAQAEERKSNALKTRALLERDARIRAALSEPDSGSAQPPAQTPTMTMPSMLGMGNGVLSPGGPAPMVEMPTFSANGGPQQAAAMPAPMSNADLYRRNAAIFEREGDYQTAMKYREMADKATEGYTLAPGAVRVGPDNRVLVENPRREPSSDLAKLLSERSALPPGSPMIAVYDDMIRTKTTHAPAMSVSVNTEKTYAGRVAEGLATDDVKAVAAARGGEASIASAHRVKQLLSENPITGTGATYATQIGKALATAGLIDGERVKSTENLASELAAATLTEISTSGLGTGQGFTNTDREFLEKAKSGRIELNASTIYRLADLRERSARAAMRRGNEIGQALRGDKNMGSVGQTLRFSEPPRYAMPLPRDLSASNLIVGAEYDLGSRGKGRWNGMAFDEVKD